MARCLFQSLPIMNELVCSGVLGQFEYSLFVKYAFFNLFLAALGLRVWAFP